MYPKIQPTNAGTEWYGMAFSYSSPKSAPDTIISQWVATMIQSPHHRLLDGVKDVLTLLMGAKATTNILTAVVVWTRRSFFPCH